MALHKAVYTFNATKDPAFTTKAVRNVLECGGADAVNSRNYDGETALHAAACLDLPETLECLLDFGADIDAQDAAGMTPIHSAVEAGAIKSMYALMKRGADPTIKNVFGDTPFDTTRIMHGREHRMTTALFDAAHATFIFSFP